MRLFRALGAALILTMSLSLVLEPVAARAADDVERAEDEADTAQDRAEAARSLLGEAASRRAGVEDQLATSLTRLNELAAELSRVSVRAEELRQAVARADANLVDINETLKLQAIDAYMRAVTVSAATVVGTDTAESAIVAATNLESAIGSDHAEVAALTVKRKQLEELRATFQQEREQVAAFQAEVDAETNHLVELLAQADAEVAERATEARAADAAHRAALDQVQLARARADERERQTGRDATTTTSAPDGTSDDPNSGPGDRPATTSTTSTTAPSTSTAPTSTTAPPEPVSGGTFSPNVERWRDLVAAHFPPGRVDPALAVLQCESNGDPEAYNPYSGASGLFQFLPATWATVAPRAGFGDSSVFSAEANVGTAAWLSAYYEGRGSSPWAPWTCKP